MNGRNTRIARQTGALSFIPSCLRSMCLACATVLLCVQVYAKALDLKLKSGDVLRIEPVAAGIIRVRLSVDGVFAPSLMERYGIVSTNWDGCETSVSEEAGVTRVSTADGTLEVGNDGSMRLLDSHSNIVCQQILPLQSKLSGTQIAAYQARQTALSEYFKGEKRATGQSQIIGSPNQDATSQPDSLHAFDLAPASNSFGATFTIGAAERFYGLGTASAHRIQLRGHAYREWAQYRGNFGFNDSEHDWEQTEGPIPLLLSTGGWGVFVNTTWVHYYDVGRYTTNKAFFWGPGGQLDFYLLIGGSLPKLIELYTEITGKPRLLPEFGYGLAYVSQITQNEHEILNDSRLFRDRGIPCDVMGVEPQWMKRTYDSSHDKEWNPEKFYVPAWMGPESKKGTFIGGLDRIGFKLSLWLVCNDDLTIQEERQIAEREGREFPATPDAWFNHLQKFVRNGARCFKMDPENLIQEHLQRHYTNGCTDLENHNLTQILYHKQMCQGFENFTKQRAMNHYCAAYAGVQHWGATTMGDNGGGRKALLWMLNYAMSGHMNTSCDMEALGPGLHFGFLQPWSQLNNWANTFQPWFLGREQEAMFRDYAQLRYRLIPYIYSAAHQGHLTGLPIIRPMPLVYPKDPRFDDCTSQYMLGDNLLVVAFSDKVSLPAGRWIDYWSGMQYEGPRDMPCVYPTNRAGGLFIRAGAIIPYGPEMDYVGEKPIETITLHIYPDKQSDYTLYEDDGDSLDYLQGAVTQTRIQCQANEGRTVLTIEPRHGTYRGMPARRNYKIWIHQPGLRTVTLRGGDNTGKNLGYDQQAATIQLIATEDPARVAPIVVTGLSH